MIEQDAILLLVICVAMNHTGLVAAVEQKIGVELPVINCVKCSTFWTTLLYGVYSTRGIIGPAAMAFFYSYVALWLELLLGFVDLIYVKCYEKIVSTAGADTSAADSCKGAAADSVS